MSAHWFVVKHVPDLIRREPKNIGVILYSEDASQPLSRFLGETDGGEIDGRTVPQFGNHFVYKAWVRQWRELSSHGPDALAHEVMRGRGPGASFYIEDGGHELVGHDARPPDEMLDDLFSMLVRPDSEPPFADEEIWLPVTGYEGRYEVSSLGRIRTLVKVGRKARGGLLKPFPKGSYRAVKLYLNGTSRTIGVHQLVLTAFRGPCPAGREGCHNDGEAANNVLANLRWDTRSANTLDAVRHGTHPQARKQTCGKGHEYVLSEDGTRRCPECAAQRRQTPEYKANQLRLQRIRRQRAKDGLPPRPTGRPRKQAE
jgi:NUMOD4 motif-containing protein/HNH endonuclease